MREPTEREEIKKEIVLKKCFDCIVEMGIENASIRAFSDATGMTASSLYYWFKDKEEIVLNATAYGVREIVDKLFDYGMKNLGNIEKMCTELPLIVQKYESVLKAVFQIATSPQYGKEIINVTTGFENLYDIYTLKLSEHLNKPYDSVRLLINLFISAIVDCTVWNEWDKLKKELKFILKLLLEEK